MKLKARRFVVLLRAVCGREMLQIIVKLQFNPISETNVKFILIFFLCFSGEQSAAIHQISNVQQKIYHRINIAIILLSVLIF